MAYSIIGLDRGSCTIKAVLLEKSFRGYEVKGVRQVAVPQDGSAPPSEEAIDAAVGTLVQEFDPEAVGYVVAVSGVDASTWVLQMPFTDPRRIEQTLPFELENYVPFDLEDMILDYEIVRTTGDKSRVVAGLMPRSRIGVFLRNLEALKVDPQALVLDSYALTYVPPGRESGERPVAVIDLGHTQTLITVRVGQVPDFLRTLQVGGLQITQALMGAFQVTFATAERMKAVQGPVALSEEDRNLRLGIVAQHAADAQAEVEGGIALPPRRSLPGTRPSDVLRIESLRPEHTPIADGLSSAHASNEKSAEAPSTSQEALSLPSQSQAPVPAYDDVRRTDPSPARRFDSSPQDWLFDAERRPQLSADDLDDGDVPTRVRSLPLNNPADRENPADWDLLSDPETSNSAERASFDDSGTWDEALRASLEVTEEPVSEAIRRTAETHASAEAADGAGQALEATRELPTESSSEQAVLPEDPRLALPGAEEVQAVLWDAMGGIFKEVRNALMAYEASEKKDIGAVLLVGGGALTTGIEERLTDYLGVKVGLPTRLGPEQIQLEGADAPLVRFALPFALSYLGAADGKYGSLDFRQGPFSYRRNYEAVRGYLVAALVLLAVGLLALSTIFVKRVSELNEEGKALDAKIASTLQESFPELKLDTSKGTDKALGLVLEEQQKMEDRGKLLGLGSNHRRAMDLLKEISTVAPAKEELALELDEFFIDGEQLKLRGTTGSFDDVEKIEKAIQGASFVKELKNDVSTKDGKKFFSITITLKGSDEDSPS